MAKKKQVIVAWAAQEGPQQQFTMSEEDEVFYGGGRGSAKTSSLIALALKYAHNPNYRGLILRRTFPQMLEIKDRCFQLYSKIDPGAKFNKDDSRWELSSGSAIQLGHCQHEEDKYRYQGFEYQLLAFDELTHFTESQYEFIKLSCRSKDPTLKPIIRATGNPGGPGHSWTKRRFVDIAPPGEVYTETMPDGRTLTRKYIKATVLDNPKLLESDPNYIARLQGIQDDRLRRMMLEGDWDAAEGLAFSQFLRTKHTKRRYDLLPGTGKPQDGMPVFISLDWGFSKPFAVLWHTITNYDKVITFDEWYGIKTDPFTHKYIPNVGIQMIAKEVAKGIVQRSSGMQISYLVADPSIKAKTGQESGSILEELQIELSNAGIPVVLGKNDRASGWMQVRSRLSDAPDKEPWWLIAENCVHLIRTLSTMPSDPENPDEIMDDGEDHCLHGDTLVHTDKGIYPIKTLVGTKGNVLTTAGRFTTYHGCRKTRTNAQLVTVEFSDGRTVTCTPDHKFMTEEGLMVAASYLTGHLVYDTIAHTIQNNPNKGEALWTQWLSVTPFNSSGESVTTSADSITKGGEFDYIGRSGWRQMERFRKVIMSTIRTWIETTINLRTWNLCGNLRTCLSIPSCTQLHTQKNVWMQPQNGTEAKKGWNGTEVIMKHPQENCGILHGSKEYVPNAEKNFSLRTVNQNSANHTVKQSNGFLAAWITLKKYVQFAVKYLLQTSMPEKKRVQNHAELEHKTCGVAVKSISPAGSGDVYCLVADNTHVFAINGGIIVSNCLDSARYFLMQVPLSVEVSSTSHRKTSGVWDEYRRNVERRSSDAPLAYSYGG